MANTNKMTKRDYFARLTAVVSASDTADKAELLTFIARQVEILDNKAAKASTKPTKTQTENEGIKDTILTALTRINKFVTITEMQAEAPELAEYSNQKLSALMRQMVEKGDITKTMEKKKSYFTVATVAEDNDTDKE